MDGWTFRATQRANPRLASIPVLAFTAQETAERMGAAGFVKKPVDLDDLVARIRGFAA